jgi:hypothetical protein
MDTVLYYLIPEFFAKENIRISYQPAFRDS